MYPREKYLVIFQPHLFTRTQDFAEEFAKSLSKFDDVKILEIYPARELPIQGVNSEWLLSKINSKNKSMTSEENLASDIQKSVRGTFGINLLISNIEIILLVFFR